MDLSVRVDRLPRPGETVSGGAVVRGAGGKGANQAVAAARLGAAVTLVGSVGDDEFGRELTARLADTGVRFVRPVVRAGSSTGVALIMVDGDGENMITVARGTNDELGPGHLTASDVDGTAALMLQLEIPVATNVAAATAARSAGVTVVLNAAPLPPGGVDELGALLSLTDVLVVNESEAAGLVRDSGGLTADRARRLLATGPRALVVTLGGRGALAVDAHSVHRVPAFAVRPVDTVGAGDAFCAELVVALAGDPDDLPGAVRRGCAAGALATTRRGAHDSLPARADVDLLLQEVSRAR
jgi:ribokinase